MTRHLCAICVCGPVGGSGDGSEYQALATAETPPALVRAHPVSGGIAIVSKMARMATVCTPAAKYVLEQGYRLTLVRSGDVFAAAVDPTDGALLVRFCNHRDAGRLYRYKGAGQHELDGLLDAASAHHFVHAALIPRFETEVAIEGLRHPLEESWSLCLGCDAVVDPDGRIGPSSDRCPGCGEPAPDDFAIDRCEACKTYVASSNGGVVLEDRCT